MGLVISDKLKYTQLSN